MNCESKSFIRWFAAYKYISTLLVDLAHWSFTYSLCFHHFLLFMLFLEVHCVLLIFRLLSFCLLWYTMIKMIKFQSLKYISLISIMDFFCAMKFIAVLFIIDRFTVACLVFIYFNPSPINNNSLLGYLITKNHISNEEKNEKRSLFIENFIEKNL